MVALLERTETLCACEIEAVLGVNQSNASRHLARLRHAGIIDGDRQGHWVHYTFKRSSPYAPLIAQLLDSARAENPTFETDFQRLNDYQGSEFSCETIGEWIVSSSLAGSPTAETRA